MASVKICVEFNSNWEEGVVTTEAQLDLATGEVTEIGTSDDGDEFEHLQSETIEAGGLTAIVEADDDNRYFVTNPSELEAMRNWVALVAQHRTAAGCTC